MSGSAIFRLAGDVRFRRVLDEAVAVRQETNEVIIVNEVSATILEFFENRGSASAESLADFLAGEYDVDLGELRKDVATHIKELLAAGILCEAEG